MIPVIPVAIMINIFRYIIVIPKPIMSLFSLSLMIVLIMYIVIKNSYEVENKLLLKIIIYTILSFIVVGLIETLYYPISLSLLHKEMSFFNNNIMANILISLPARAIQICIISFIVVRKNNEIQINLFNAIVKNKFFTNSFIIILLSSISIIIYSTKLMMIDGILIRLNIIDQLIIVVILISVPIILITWFLMFVNYLLTKQKQIIQSYENLLEDNIMTDVNKD